MAGRGPAPKDASQRRNRVPPARGEWVDLPPLERAVLGPLPKGKWGAHSRAMWDAWRRDPVTSQWSSADVAFALDTIRLFEDSRSTDSERRLRMDALGLSPKGKRDLRWRVQVGEVVSIEQPQRSSSRARLRAVDAVG